MSAQVWLSAFALTGAVIASAMKRHSLLAIYALLSSADYWLHGSTGLTCAMHACHLRHVKCTGMHVIWHKYEQRMHATHILTNLNTANLKPDGQRYELCIQPHYLHH